MAQYKLSRFVHLFHRNGEMILYHSLKMQSISVSGCEVDMEYRWIDLEPDTELYIRLVQLGFISSDEDDDALLDSGREEIKEPYISTAYFFLTKNCNLACKYCFEKQSEVENSSEGIMSAETFDRGLDFYIRLINLDMSRFEERKTIIFYGGEPFHNKTVLYMDLIWILNKKIVSVYLIAHHQQAQQVILRQYL